MLSKVNHLEYTTTEHNCMQIINKLESFFFKTPQNSHISQNFQGWILGLKFNVSQFFMTYVHPDSWSVALTVVFSKNKFKFLHYGRDNDLQLGLCTEQR